LTYWVDVSQAIGGIATAGALIFVGINTLLTRKQIRLMQEQVGRAWIGTEKGGISVTDIFDGPVDLIVRYKNYGNVPAKLLNWRSKSYLAGKGKPKPKSEIKDEVLASKHRESLGQYVFPDNTTQISLTIDEVVDATAPTTHSNDEDAYLVGISIEYEDVHHIRGEYGFIMLLESLGERGFQVSKINEWFG
jgi:hypothetical protein